MNSISHILSSIKAFSTSLFTFSSFVDPLSIINDIPESVSNKLNSDDFIYHLDQASIHISWLNDFLKKHIVPALKRKVSKLSKNKSESIPYADFRIDEPPLFKKVHHQQLSFDDIVKQSIQDGKALQPIKRRTEFSFVGTCPFCGAPKEYIYDNAKGRGQLQCKACKNTFHVKLSYGEQTGIFCPHCQHQLYPTHDRKGYVVYSCPSYTCSFYLHNKSLLDTNQADHLKTSSNQYNLHYHYREFKFNLEDLNVASKTLDTKVNLSKIHVSSTVLGLVLTYYVNYGLSARKTALILKQVHGITISHQTIINYAQAASKHVNFLVNNYDYQLSNTLVGDETYIKVRGKNHYVFFWSDPLKKIITSHTIYPNRDTLCACQSIYDCLRHYDTIPDDLTFITDGNPIYNAAQVFFHIHGIDFTLHQVIGIKNKDEVSKKYRPFKQIEERLNRTYKQNYYGTNGYHKLECANSYMVLFVCFFNFLRQHSSLKYKTPVDDGLFEDDMLMQDKWLRLIELSSTMQAQA